LQRKYTTTKKKSFQFKNYTRYHTIKLDYRVFENRRRNIIILNRPRGMSAKLAANKIPTHACTYQRHTLA